MDPLELIDALSPLFLRMRAMGSVTQEKNGTFGRGRRRRRRRRSGVGASRVIVRRKRERRKRRKRRWAIPGAVKCPFSIAIEGEGLFDAVQLSLFEVIRGRNEGGTTSE